MKAKKSLGQHFLVDSAYVRRIVDVCGLEAGRAEGILEIGPGGGALTEGLVGIEKSFAAVEADFKLRESLLRRFPGTDIRVGDAAELDLEELAADRGVSPWLVVGNLPYNVGTDILIRVLTRPKHVSAVVVMLQLEVALKFCSGVSGEGYGPLSAWRWPWWSAEVLFHVPPGAFSPVPKVNSAVCLFRPKENPLLSPGEIRPYRDFLRRCFAAPRKTLKSNLRHYPGFEAVVLPEGVRPSAVAPVTYAELYGKITS